MTEHPKHICCVRLTHWPIDRLRRQQRRRHFGSRDIPWHGHPAHETRTRVGRPYSGESARAQRSETASQQIAYASADSLRERREYTPHGQDAHATFLLIRTSANRQIVIAVSDDAEAMGIKVGMTLPEARALCAGIRAIEHEPHRDAVALEALARWMLRFTPIVSIGDGSNTDDANASQPGLPEPQARVNQFSQGERLVFEGVAAHPRDQLRVRAAKSSASAPSHATLLLDLTGSQFVFGSYANIVTQIDQALRRLGLRAAIATGPTIGAAWAMTYSVNPDPARKTTDSSRLVPPPSGEVRWGRRTPDDSQSQTTSHQPPPPTLPQWGRSQTDSALQIALNTLPPSALRIDDDTIATLHHLGITSIGLLRKLPRRELLTRFGPLLLKRLNQAMGLEDEVLIPIRPAEPIESGVEFEFGVDSLELLWTTIQQHVQAIVDQLTRRGLGVRTLEFVLLLQDDSPLTQTLNLSRPSRDPKRLFRLLRVVTETLATSTSHSSGGLSSSPSGGGWVGAADAKTPCDSSHNTRQSPPHLPRGGREPARYTDTRKKITARRLFGARFCGLKLRVIDALRLRDDQIALLEGENVAIEDAITDLVERLSLRISDRITQARLVESHLPERAWKSEHALTHGRPTPVSEVRRRPGSERRTNPDIRPFGVPQDRRENDASHNPDHRATSTQHPGQLEFNPKLIVMPDAPHPGEPPANPRPLHMTAPQEIHVMVSPSHDRDGRPIAYTTPAGIHRRILHARGPERIAGEWWRGHAKTRDYFDIEDDTHHRLWMFRVNDNGRWFVQGTF